MEVPSNGRKSYCVHETSDGEEGTQACAKGRNAKLSELKRDAKRKAKKYKKKKTKRSPHQLNVSASAGLELHAQPWKAQACTALML